jgi:transposase
VPTAPFSATVGAFGGSDICRFQTVMMCPRARVRRGGSRFPPGPDDGAPGRAESFEDGALVSHVARRLCLTPQQLFAWRRTARREADVEIGSLSFARVVIEPASAALPAAESAENKSADGRPPVIEVDVGGSSVWIWPGSETAVATDHRRVEGRPVASQRARAPRPLDRSLQWTSAKARKVPRPVGLDDRGDG